VASFISDAKICPANMLIVEECLAGSLERDAANFHHVSVMRNLERVIHVLAHQQDGYALFGYIADQGKNFVDQNRREAKRRFIEHEKLRFRHQAAPDGAHLLLAAGESARVLPATFFKAWKEFIDAGQPGVRLAAQRRKKTTHQQIFFNRHSGPELAAFGNQRYVPLHSVRSAHGGYVFAAKKNAAVPCRQSTGYGVECGGLASAVR